MKTGSASVTGKGKKRLNGFLRFVRTVIILALILGITGGIAVAAVNIAVIGTAKKTILTPDEAEKLEGVDCIIVLGCQVKKDVPSDMLYDRIVTGVDLYRRGVSEVLFMRLIAASTLDDYRRSGAYLIDLRTKEEYEQGHIPGAVNIPYDFLEDYKKRLPRNRLLVLYCEWGTTSILAGRKLSQYGYDVLSVNGGLQAYRRFSNM